MYKGGIHPCKYVQGKYSPLHIIILYEGFTRLHTNMQKGTHAPMYKGGILPHMYVRGRYSPMYTYEGRTHLRTYVEEGTHLCQGRYSPTNIILCTRG